ncbi:dipeptidyl aminopeptidase/acylaminoacyl peptidase [Haloferula helveola]|uniref:Dipeptidyl aminopeptidase/acylaminoacyl peptidase n=2 Tax=Haloferula helveola TaxID=490095 RepID=A0ABN6H1D0_9BACT|nr:dipeptidyl aminopeptidase/acylaminoacyl peptidase [Haloferula helveola]
MLLSSFLPAAQEGSGQFEALTGKWFGVAKTPVPNSTVEVAFSPDGSGLVFAREAPDGRELVPVDPATGKAGKPVRPGTGWKSFRVGEGGELLLETGKGWKRWKGGGLESVDAPPKNSGGQNRQRPGRRGGRSRGSWESPDGKHRVEVKDGALFLMTGDQRKELISAESGEVFRDPPVWTGDSSRFAIWRTHDIGERQVHYIDSAPDDQLQPKHFTRSYPKPGDEIDTRAPWIGFTDQREVLAPDLSLIENPFQCGALRWRDDGERLTYEFTERGYGKFRVIEVDSEKRSQRVLVNEESDTYVFVSGATFRHDLDDGKEIIWMSERDGWRHLYLLDGKDGSVKRQLTKGDWVVRKVIEVDDQERELLVTLSGYYSDQDPYLIHYARVGIDDGKVTLLTSSPGTHDRFERSPDGAYLTCRWSRVDHPPVTELRKWSDGSLVTVLATANDSKLKETGWRVAEPFVTKDRDGKFDIHGIVILPPDFDPAKRYPVVEYIYAGPHDAFVPKSWRPWMAPRHEVAVNGFIVVQIDGRGTNHRSREFSHFCYKNLKDAGFPDRIAWMKAAAKRYPQMDLDRVGIFGGSAGGQNALGALLFHADFYKAAAADCGCHDNRMDKIWWNEQWMDWPVGPHYAENSNVTHAKNLKGALLLTVGELDTNVDPSSTYQVVDALVKADKDFEFLPIPGANHGAGESRYAQRQRVDFFKRHLGGPEPR